ncbi:MAG: hypothetical protein WDM77_05290 [Steroidobacteraceae bacterium]
MRHAPFAYGESRACATLVYAAADAGDLLEPVRALLEDGADESGVTLLDGLLIIRLLDGDAPRLRTRVVRVAGLIRPRCRRTLTHAAQSLVLLTLRGSIMNLTPRKRTSCSSRWQQWWPAVASNAGSS